MNKSKFFEYVNTPWIINQNELNDIKELIQDYPYFHTAHLLLLKALHKSENIKFEPQLQKSAISIADRRKLYRILFYEDQVFEKRLTENEEVQATENLMEITTNNLQIEKKEEPLELLDFTFEEDKKVQEPVPEEKKIKKESLLDYEFSEQTSNTFQTADYLSGYKIEDSEPIDDVYFNSLFTFEEWIKMMKDKKAPVAASDDKLKQKKENHQQFELIDNFIKESPKIIPKKEGSKTNDEIIKESLKEKTDFITQTLADIYTKQGHYAKAILAYEKLSLKYPEKNSYFADQIKKLEKLIKEQ